MAQTLEVKRYGGTVTFSATSDPNPPILTFSSTGNTWASRNGEVITIAANNSASGRSFDITVTATTSANTSYDGIASAYSAYTITQEGTGTTPTYFNINYNLGGQSSSNILGQQIEVWMGKESETEGGQSQDSQNYIISDDSRKHIDDVGDLNATADTSYVNFGCEVTLAGGESNCRVENTYGTYSTSGYSSAYITVPTAYCSPTRTAQVNVYIS